MRFLFKKIFLTIYLFSGLLYNKVNAQANNCCVNLSSIYNNETLLNTYYPPSLNQTVNSGSTSILLDAVPPNDVFGNSYGSTPIRTGDLLLIIQMQGASFNSSNTKSYGSGSSTSGYDGLGATGYTSLNSTGNYEYVIALNDVPLVGGTLNLSGLCNGGLKYTYENYLGTATSVVKKFQIVRVPRFKDLTLTNTVVTTAWNGSVGGIIALEVSGNLNLNGNAINASGKGFRGGYQDVRASGNNNTQVATTDITLSSGKGEGISGTPRFMWNGLNKVDYGTSWAGYPGGNYGQGAPGNAAGGGNVHNSGGGGGGNGGAGGTGGKASNAGGDNSAATGGRYGINLPYIQDKIFMGGGGGGGDANNAVSGVKGGPGGGIIMISAGKISGIGSIISNGLAGEPGVYSGAPDGAGGGGAGGSVFILTSNSSAGASISIQVKGGKGGNTLNDPSDPHGPGGGGGGGIVMHNLTGAAPAIDRSAGASGISNNGSGTPHGASAGIIGTLVDFNTGSTPPNNTINLYPNPIADFTSGIACVGSNTLFTNTSNVANDSSSSIIKYTWSFGDGTTSNSQNPTHLYSSPGIYTVTLTVETNWGCTDYKTKNIEIKALTTPAFTAVSPICSGGTLSPLPTTSTNGITGTWSPALNNTATTTYTFTPTAGQCAETATMTITVTPNTIPTFTQVSTVCSGTPLAPLPTSSTNGITGTWNPALNNTATTTYTFTPAAGQCAGNTTMTITVAPNIIPTFTQISPVCSGDTLSPLPTTSNNGITGTWSPALNNTATTTYTFTPAAGQCADVATMSITIKPIPAVPSGNTTQIFCSAATVANLTATGNNVKWYDAPSGGNVLNDTDSLVDGAIYYASQSVDGCESIRLAVKAIYNNATIKASKSTICSGESVDLTVQEISTAICGMEITQSNIPPGNPIPGFTYKGLYNGHHYYLYNTPTTWTQGEAIARANGGYLVCINDMDENNFVSNLTNNNIWIGMFRDPVTGNFRWLDCMNITFTNWRPGEPNNGPMGEPYVQIIKGCSFGLNTWNNVDNNSSNGSCYSDMVPIMEIDPLLFISSGITKTYLWSTGATTPTISVTPSVTTEYWVDITMNGVTCRKYVTVNVTPKTLPAFAAVAPVCYGTVIPPLPAVSSNGITGTWSPALNNTATTTYTFTPEAGQCADTTTLTITVTPKTLPTFTAVAAVCVGTAMAPLPTTSSNGITGTWSPALNNTATTTYTFTPTSGQCAEPATMTITVTPKTIPAFTAVPAVCSGNVINPLPTMSNNGVTGTWSPALNNTATTTYTFIPTAGQCAETAIMTIPVTPRTLPIFTPVGPICNGTTTAPLSTTSNNGITGTWSPAFNNTATTTYTFTPNAGQCAESTTMTITVNPVEQVTFNISIQGKDITVATINYPFTLFEYSLDRINWQSSPVFTNLPNGIYRIYIRNLSGCEAGTGEVLLFPMYNVITPEGDGLNEVWRIPGIEKYPQTRVRVFDRQGNRVLDKIAGTAFQWDGKFLSRALPTGTYWYVLVFEGGKELKGFLLIKNRN